MVKITWLLSDNISKNTDYNGRMPLGKPTAVIRCYDKNSQSTVWKSYKCHKARITYQNCAAIKCSNRDGLGPHEILITNNLEIPKVSKQCVVKPIM
ncbi:hypothetical protein GJ496_009074 [Pomphorhynchus laevis]|nr:hypothetical protein GJ496_009074 [Pomphorhynchus laevis]